MRGKLFSIAAILSDDRITPADAGKTNTYAVSNKGRIGSPPRMRGKLKRQAVFELNDRITPADAGKTCRILNSAAT